MLDAGGVAPWQWVWAEIGRLITDQPTGANNRFEVAAQLNARTGPSGPFWGRPRSQPLRDLDMTKPTFPHRGPHEIRRVARDGEGRAAHGIAAEVGLAAQRRRVGRRPEPGRDRHAGSTTPFAAGYDRCRDRPSGRSRIRPGPPSSSPRSIPAWCPRSARPGWSGMPARSWGWSSGSAIWLGPAASSRVCVDPGPSAPPSPTRRAGSSASPQAGDAGADVAGHDEPRTAAGFVDAVRSRATRWAR